jgi:hypothetical protein
VVQLGKGTVSVLFRPTHSHYLFRVIADPGASPLLRGKAADDVEFHAGVPGAPNGYVEAEILEMSKQLASAAVKDVLT